MLPILISDIDLVIRSKCVITKSIISFVLLLPVLIQTIFGGKPLINCIFIKSESLLTMAKPSSFAKDQTARSSEELNPTSLTCTESGCWFLISKANLFGSTRQQGISSQKFSPNIKSSSLQFNQTMDILWNKINSSMYLKYLIISATENYKLDRRAIGQRDLLGISCKSQCSQDIFLG